MIAICEETDNIKKRIRYGTLKAHLSFFPSFFLSFFLFLVLFFLISIVELSCSGIQFFGKLIFFIYSFVYLFVDTSKTHISLSLSLCVCDVSECHTYTKYIHT